MGFNFVGDIDIHERQKNFICEVLENKGYKDCNVLIEPVGIAGDNYIANVKRIIVKQNGETLKMIAKVATDNPVMRGTANLCALFKNEHIVYTKLFPKFREMQDEIGIPKEEQFRHAECYGTFIEAPNEVILLEDLKESNFNILDRFKPMTNENIKLVLQNFALYHSLCYVLKNQNPEEYVNIKSNLCDLINRSTEMAQMTEIRNQFFQMQEKNILEQIDEQYKAVFKGTISEYDKLIDEHLSQYSGSKRSVIVQGDGWTNNIMFAVEDNQPSKCVVIDYQMAQARPPIYDVMYMLFNGTDTEQRIENYGEFINFYYSELDKSLNRFGLKADDVYPREEVNADMVKYAKEILAVSIIIASLVVKDLAEASKLKDTMSNITMEDTTDEAMATMMKHSPETQALFDNKMTGLAKSLVKLGLL